MHKRTWACINPCGDGCDGDHETELQKAFMDSMLHGVGAVKVTKDGIERVEPFDTEQAKHPSDCRGCPDCQGVIWNGPGD